MAALNVRRPYRAMLLDLDDTVFDFQQAEKQALHLTLQPLHMTLPEHTAAYHEINKGYWKALEQGKVTQAQLRLRRFEDLLRRFQVDADAAQVAQCYAQNLGMQAVMIDGALDAVKQIAAVMPIAAVTNGISDIQRGRMKISPLKDYISCLIISEEVGVSKPDPRLFYTALEKLGGIQPCRAIAVGDSPSSDIRAANAADIHVCWYNAKRQQLPENMHVEYEIDDIRLLPRIVLQ